MNNSNVRYRIETDPEPLNTGDVFTAASLPDIGIAERDRRQRAHLNKVEADGGPWGYIIERKCGGCGAWETVDSCWGFDSLEACEQDAQDFADAVGPAVLAEPAAGLLEALKECSEYFDKYDNQSLRERVSAAIGRSEVAAAITQTARADAQACAAADKAKTAVDPVAGLQAACELLCFAYKDGEDNGGSVQWEILNDAHELAKAAIAAAEAKA